MSDDGELRLIVSDEAVEDIDDIGFYLAQQSRESGRRFLSATTETFFFLLQNTGAGRTINFASIYGTSVRQWPVRGFANYLVFYIVLDDGIEILRVLHGAQNLPEILN